jgi:hypothetical protein
MAIPTNYFPNTEHLRTFMWLCNVSDEEDGAMFLLVNIEGMRNNR